MQLNNDFSEKDIDMSIVVTDYVRKDNWVAEFDCVLPIDKIIGLPENFENINNSEQLLYSSETATLKSLFRQKQIPLHLMSSSDLGFIQNNGIEWLGPTLFISAELLKGNTNIVSIALNVLSSYLTDLYKGFSGSQSVKLDIIIEKKDTGEYKRISFDGSPEALNKIVPLIENITNE